MSTKHTPGPWTVERRYRGQAPDEVYIGSQTSCPIFTDANARLIAAAPKLLEAMAEVELRATQARGRHCRSDRG